MTNSLKSPVQKFYERINKTKSCWLWTGYKNHSGYGCMTYFGKTKGAHVVSFLIHKGKIKKGLVIMHSCNNPSCVNPNHLSQGTHKQNMHDSAKIINNKLFSKIGIEDNNDPFYTIKRLIKKHGSQRKVADELRISPQYLCDIIHKRRVVTDDLAKKLGYAQIWVKQ